MKRSSTRSAGKHLWRTGRGAVFGAAVLLVAAVRPGWAVDEVIRHSEGPAGGTVTQISKTEVVVERQIGDPINVPANDIVAIRWDGEPPKLNLARSDEQGGRLDRALAGFQECLSEISDKPNIKTAVDYLIARTTAKIALNDDSKIDEAIQMLERFRQANPDHYRSYDALKYLGEVHLANENYVQAQSAFDQLGNAPWPDLQMAAKIASARLKLAQDDVAGALADFQAVAGQEASGPAETARKHEAMLGKATCLMKQQNLDEAITTLEQVANESSADATSVLAEVYVRKGDCLQSLGRSKEAVLAYLHVPVLFPQETTAHAESLFHLSRLWGVVGRPDRAAAARAELESKYPNSEWTKKLGTS